MTGRIFDIKEFSIHDGPGGRVTVFFKGCPLRCLWCHNPEGQRYDIEIMHNKKLCTGCLKCVADTEDECFRRYGRSVEACPIGALALVGDDYTAEALAEKLIAYKHALDALEGGVTVSGGEPLLQHKFLYELLVLLGNAGIHRAIETSGYAEEMVFKEILTVCDLVIMDIKIFDNNKHRQYTGVENSIILKNAQYLKSSGIPHIFRTPMIPHITDDPKNIKDISEFVGNSVWERIPYNTLAGAKYSALGRKYEL